MGAAALLVGAGVGERLAGDQPKAFVRIGGRTLLELSAASVDRCERVEGVVVAAPPGWETRARDALAGSVKLLDVVAGGETRQASVRAALDAVPEGFDAIVCHDVARPFAPTALFEAVLVAVEQADGAIPALPVPDTVKRIEDGEVGETIPREGLVLVQTPQAFRRAALESAHAAAEADGYEATDDAALLERVGLRVAVVPGDPANLKVTRREDLALAEAILRSRR